MWVGLWDSWRLSSCWGLPSCVRQVTLCISVIQNALSYVADGCLKDQMGKIPLGRGARFPQNWLLQL